MTPHHDGRDRLVVVAGPQDDGTFCIAIDGVSYNVDAQQVRPGTWSLLFDGRCVVVDLDKRHSATGVAIVASVGTSEIALTVKDGPAQPLATSAGARSSVSRGEAVRASIAGKVVKLCVAVGDVVAPNTPVIAIEAMKMENELVCERGGTVIAIHKQVGQAVDTGELLVEID